MVRAIAMLLVLGCTDDPPPDMPDAAPDSTTSDSAQPDAPELDVAPDTLDAGTPGFGFVDVTEEMGLGDLKQWDENFPVPCYLGISADCTVMSITGGVAVRDVNGDGRPDLFVTRMEAPDLLLINTSAGFEPRNTEFGFDADDISFTSGAAFGDVDNDGDADLYVGGVTEWTSRFYEFEDGVFVERSDEWGVELEDGHQHTQMSACFGDYDLDGRLDLHTTEWRHARSAHLTTHAHLLHNTGTGFEPATTTSGTTMLDVGRPGVWSFIGSFLDLDGNRFPELLVAADFGSSRLFWNTNGSVFEDVTVESGVGTDENGMGSAIGDIDGDGDLDWFVSSIYDGTTESAECPRCEWGKTGNRMYRYEGATEFTDITDDAGVRDGGWGWGTRFFDYDLDGDLDLVLTNGVRWTPEHTGFATDAVRLWENDGTGHFTDVAFARNLVDHRVGRGLVTLDYDNDGDHDVLLVNSLEGPRLFRNDYADGRAWLVVKPVGVRTNRDGFGAIVRVWPTEDSTPIVRHAGNGCGFLGHTEGTPHFGLGDLDVVHQVEVYWPLDKIRQRFFDVPTRQVLEAVEPDPA